MHADESAAATNEPLESRLLRGVQNVAGGRKKHDGFVAGEAVVGEGARVLGGVHRKPARAALLPNRRDAGRDRVVPEAFSLREDKDREGRRRLATAHPAPASCHRQASATHADARTSNPRTSRIQRIPRISRTYRTCHELLLHRVQDPIDELHRLVAAERLRQLERFVDDDVARRAAVEKLADGEPQDDAIERRHARKPPVLGRFGDERVDLARRSRSSSAPAARQTSGRSRARPRRREDSRPRTCENLFDIAAGRLPTDRASARRPGARDDACDACPRCRCRRRSYVNAACAAGWRSVRCSVAISTAATAASQPLLPGPSPARSSASSTELVVSTPKVIGTPVAAAASVMPCAHADAMYSKCGVSPRIRQPRQTTAAKCPREPLPWLRTESRTRPAP